MIAAIPYIVNVREEPDDTQPGFRWKCDVFFPHLVDEDGLTRYELVPGETARLMFLHAETLIAEFEQYPDLEPGEWPHDRFKIKDTKWRQEMK